MNRSSTRLVVLDDVDGLAVQAAEIIVDRAQQSIRRRGRFVIALSGGSTPTRLHKLLASPLFADRIDWSRVFVFWGDERLVPSDSPDSNERMARETLLSRVPVQGSQIYPVPTGNPLKEAGAEYERTIIATVGPDARFDLILLGLGEDGHTASLFPGHKDGAADGRFVTTVSDSPKPPPSRITFTFETINRARCALVLVSGAGKRDALKAVLDEASSPVLFPAKRIRPTDGAAYWLVDRTAYTASPTNK